MLIKEFRIGRIFGIEFSIDISWIVIFLLVSTNLFFLYRDEYPELAFFYPELGSTIFVLMSLITSIFFFISLLLHEMGHSFVAIRTGIPVQGIVLFIFGGVAKIAHEPSRPLQEFMIAIAGPLVSVALAALFLGFAYLVPGRGLIFILAEWLGLINLVLALFNMLPGFPMDGGRVLRAIIWGISGSLLTATQIASWIGRGFAVLLILGGLTEFIPAESGEFRGTLWMSLIGIYLFFAARKSAQQSKQIAQLQQHRAGEVLLDSRIQVESHNSIEHVMAQVIMMRGRAAVEVINNEEVVGAITLQGIRQIPSESWSTTPVGEVMTSINFIDAVDAEQPLDRLLGTMNNEPSGILKVLKNDILMGILTREQLADYLRLHTGLEPG